ncbi:hypothetical protein CERSUDRAFT_113212 [Gelatoporia subvermispora B]|uniref:Uncharacterized protein n=1 Tax=Ceriporiopsis subvermispora (strain B) TaxID=914234 RepID=M2PNR1_CERS8|nr:hypothetical protein CERSUDRAFT_113212 [Gelatoporia subvermispora B]
MFEEVCLVCGRPTSVDGRIYCSDQCESIDSTSPSVSTTSSAVPSPYLHSMTNPGNLADVPALMPSALGASLAAHQSRKTQANRLSVSSSSSSVCWSAITDDEEDSSPALFEDDLMYKHDLLGPDVGSSKSSGPLGILLSKQSHIALSYARRPSTTNNRSTIPLLHHRSSSTSSPPTPSRSLSQSVSSPFLMTDDDYSDAPPASVSSVSSARSHSRRERPHSSMRMHQSDDADKDETVTSKPKRNRASLPAYFSLLNSTSTSPATGRTPRFPSSLHALSRSLHSSPGTPRVAGPVVDTTMAYAHAQTRAVPAEMTPRGRGRRHESRARASSTSRSPSPQPHVHAHSHAAHARDHAAARHGPSMRARLDSVEKVKDWVAQSPVVNVALPSSIRGRTHAHRRNSSPARSKPRPAIILADSGVSGLSEAIAQSLRVTDTEKALEMSEDDRRGRRKANELDVPPVGVDHQVAPGYGNGRSGLRARGRDREHRAVGALW